MILRIAVLSFLVPSLVNGATLTLACKGAFGADASESSLQKKFGVANVRSEDIQIGEGETEPGTVVFPGDKDRRIEILWQNPKEKRSPSRLRVVGKRWRTTEGISVGMSLRTVEKYNRRPFSISGFSWDYGGGAYEWRGGLLDHREDAACQLRLFFDPHYAPDDEARQLLIGSVEGDHLYSSGHPSMQKLNPTVSEIDLEYK